MPSPTVKVQDANASINASQSSDLSFGAPTGSGTSIVVAVGGLFGGGVVSPTITDDKGNTYVLVYLSDLAFRQAAVYWCQNPTAGVVKVSLANVDQVYGLWSIQEVLGLTGTDQAAEAAVTGTPASCTVTMSAPDSSPNDYVVGVLSTGNGSADTGIQDPPTGYISLGAFQNDNNIAGVGICYRINASDLTDSVEWSVDQGTEGDPGILVSFSGHSAAVPLPGRRKRSVRQGGNVMGLDVKEWF
jgi:hypothetical protein